MVGNSESLHNDITLSSAASYFDLAFVLDAEIQEKLLLQTFDHAAAGPPSSLMPRYQVAVHKRDSFRWNLCRKMGLLRPERIRDLEENVSLRMSGADWTMNFGERTLSLLQRSNSPHHVRGRWFSMYGYIRAVRCYVEEFKDFDPDSKYTDAQNRAEAAVHGHAITPPSAYLRHLVYCNFTTHMIPKYGLESQLYETRKANMLVRKVTAPSRQLHKELYHDGKFTSNVA